MSQSKLMLHAGARVVTLDELLAVKAPEPTATWFPLSHAHVLRGVQGALAEAGFLVESARSKRAEKRGGGRGRVEVQVGDLVARQGDPKLLALDEALAKLERQHPPKAQLVKLRYFAGLPIREAAAALGISTATADRYWAYARAWLQREMTGADPESR